MELVPAARPVTRPEALMVAIVGLALAQTTVPVNVVPIAFLMTAAICCVPPMMSPAVVGVMAIDAGTKSAATVSVALDPLVMPGELAVITYVPPIVVPSVNCTVATPTLFVRLVAVAKAPPVPCLPHVTMLLASAIGLPALVAYCAVAVTTDPCTPLEADRVTTNFPGSVGIRPRG